MDKNEFVKGKKLLETVKLSTDKTFGEMEIARCQAVAFIRQFAGEDSSFYKSALQHIENSDVTISTGFIGSILEGFLQFVESGLHKGREQAAKQNSLEKGDRTLEQAKSRLMSLLEDGETFTYENFATKGEYGYPDAYTPDFIAWRTRMTGAIHALFGAESAPTVSVVTASGVELIGYGPDKFKLAMSHLLGALKAGVAILEEDSFGELTGSSFAPGDLSKKIFVVHGRDGEAKNEAENLLREFGLEPVVLHRQPDEGQTIIEKFEKHSDVGYAIILLTPDEIAYLKQEDNMPDGERKKENRARPNVIFEFGYFVGKLGRSRVCCLYTHFRQLGVVFGSFSVLTR